MWNLTRKSELDITEMRKQQIHKTNSPFVQRHKKTQNQHGKMRFLLLQMMMAACAASPQDLSGKMFVFPKETNTAHVRLTPSREDFSKVTVCHRSFTDLKRDHILFSMATPSNANGMLVFWDEANKELEPHIKDKKSEYRGQDYKPNAWHSICTTWDSESGLVQMWFNSQSLMKKYSTSGSNIRGTTIIILGQEQDSHGGGFDLKQSFVGMMSDVHMWDYVLSPCEIHSYMDDLNYTPGNVVNWRALEFQIRDTVLIEDKIQNCQAN